MGLGLGLGLGAYVQGEAQKALPAQYGDVVGGGVGLLAC